MIPTRRPRSAAPQPRTRMLGPSQPGIPTPGVILPGERTPRAGTPRNPGGSLETLKSGDKRVKRDSVSRRRRIKARRNRCGFASEVVPALSVLWMPSIPKFLRDAEGEDGPVRGHLFLPSQGKPSGHSCLQPKPSRFQQNITKMSFPPLAPRPAFNHGGFLGRISPLGFSSRPWMSGSTPESGEEPGMKSLQDPGGVWGIFGEGLGHCAEVLRILGGVLGGIWVI